MAFGRSRRAGNLMRALIYFAVMLLLPLLLRQLPPKLFQQACFFATQRPLREQIGSPQPSPAQALLQAPAPNLLMVAGQQHLRHPHAFIILWPRVVRTIEQTISKRLFAGRVCIIQGPGQPSHRRIDQRQRGNFPAGQDKIAERQFLIHATLQQALIDTLVASTKQDRARRQRQFSNAPIIQWLTLRGQVNYSCRNFA